MFEAAVFFILLFCSIKQTDCMPPKQVPAAGVLTLAEESKSQKKNLLKPVKKEKKEESKQEIIRKNFGEKAQKVDMQDMITLLALYRSVDANSSDEFAEKEVKSYVDSGRWRWQYPEPPCCVIL